MTAAESGAEQTAREATAAAAASKRFRIYTRTGDAGTSCLYTGQRLPKDHTFFQALGDVDELNSCIGIAREFTAGTDDQLAGQLATIQSRLIDVGAALATPASAERTGKSAAARVAHTRFGSEHTNALEKWLDAMDDSLPPLRHFILPSGGRAAVFLHQARSVCRRAERTVVALEHTLQCEEEQPGSADRSAQATATATATPNPSDPQAAAPAPAPAAPAGSAGVSQSGGTPAAAEPVDSDVRVYLNRLSDYLFTAARYMAYKEGRPEQTYQKAPAA